MTKISSKSAYSLKNPVVSDYFVGTDSANNFNTVSFDFESTADLINKLNGNSVVKYIFSTEANIQTQVLFSGNFLSQGAETATAAISKLYFNNDNHTEDNLLSLFSFIKNNTTLFLLKLIDKSDLTKYVFYSISSMETFEKYSSINVSSYIANSEFTNLSNNSLYYFEFVTRGINGKDSIQLLSTNGTSGTATLIDGVLNIPQYSGATNLLYTPSASFGVVSSNTGDDATIPLADTTNAGLLSASEKTKLAAITGTNTGDETLSTIKTKLGITTLSGANTGDQDLSGKVDKVTGKGLISDSEISRLAGVSNYDNSSNITALSGKQPLATVLTNTTAAFTTAQETKLAGIALGATANSLDATLLARANHSGTQLASTISDIQTTITNNTAVLANTAKASFDSTSSARLANTSGTNTGDQDLSGLVVKNTTITGATKTKITYDSKGLVTSGTNATTDDIGEGVTNLYWSNSKTISSVLNGISISGTSIISTDTILQALGKAQNQINALAGGVTYQGVWNASTNDPALTSSVGTKGYYYVVSVVGSTNLNGVTDWKLGDWAIYNGTSWQKVDNTDAVISVNGYAGIVAITTADVPESINKKYVTDANLTVINNTSNTNTGDQNLQTVTNGVGNNTTTNSITANSFIKQDGESYQFLKANGSVDNTNYTPTSRSLTINGTAYDLSADRAWTIPTYSLPVSTSSILGGVKIGDGVNVTVDGTISVSTNYQAPLSSTGIVKSTAGTISYLTDNTANWDTAYSERFKWDGSTLANSGTSATGRTSLGATTVGSNIFTSTNPSAITFLQANTDNTVSWLSATSFRTAIGAGTGVGSVTSVAAITLTSTATSDLTSSVANGTAAAVITLNVPDAGIGSRGVVTTGVQTFAGNKTFVGSSILKGTSVNDGPILGSEMLTTASVSTNWVGTSFATGYQHTAGNTSVLQTSGNVLTDSIYQVQYTISYTSSPAGTFTISVGGATSPSKSSVGTGYYTALTTSTTPLTITPSTTFNGKVIVSLKILNPASSVMTIQSSNGVVRNEFRYSSTGVYNMFLGVNSGGYNSSADFNTFVGFNSGRFTSTGSSNTALGGNSLYSNTTGYSNVALGSNALYSNLTGNNNTAIGDQALLSNIDGYNNQGLGSSSLGANTSGYNNVGVGVNSLNRNTTGHDNVAIGQEALQYNETGYYNIALGTTSGNNIVGGTHNIVIGYGTTTQTASDQSSIVIGTSVNGLGSNTTVIGNGSTVKTGIFGRTLIGASTLPTDDLTSLLQVKGYVSATGYKVPSRTGFLKADGTIDDTAYSTGGGTTTGTNTGDETAARIGALINGSTNAAPNNTDYVATSDATTPLLKKITWTNVKTFLKTYFDTLYSDKAYNIYISTTVSIDTEHPGTYNGSGTYTQNGRNVMIANGANQINITCATAAPSDFIASYTKLGTSNITFVAVSSNITAFGNLFTLSGAVGSTALLTRNGAGQYYLQINNL